MTTFTDLDVWADVDLLSAGVLADPHPYLAALREHDPVHWHARHDAWMITRYDDVGAAYRDARLSSDRITPFLAGLAPDRRCQAQTVLTPLSQWMVFQDPPAHTRLRQLVAPAFSAPGLARLSERIAAHVDALLDAFIAGAHTDLMGHVASPLPAMVIAELLGVPDERRADFRGWSDELALVVFGAVELADRYERAQAGLEGLRALFRELIARSRAREAPGENLIGDHVARERAGQPRLDTEELVAMGVLLLFAGAETTANLIAVGLVHLLGHPAQLALLREREPELIGPAVEELLRFDGPAKLSYRYAREDLTLRGREIRAGERVLLLHGAANRDPRRFPRPDELDLTRTPNPHLGFGQGIHSCLGGALARLEARIALPAILRRLPGLRSTAGPELEALAWTPTILGRSLRRLEVEHDARPTGRR